MIVYDCEIARAIPGRGEEKRPGIEYCRGWDDFAGMGISCICAYDYRERRYRVFLEDGFADFARLVINRRLVIGYNNHKFDDPLCAAHGISIGASYDLMVELRMASDDYGPGLSLDAVAAANIQRGKSGHGADTPLLWQAGKTGQVIDYCLQDVAVTVDLVNRVIGEGRLADPRSGKFIEIESPVRRLGL